MTFAIVRAITYSIHTGWSLFRDIKVGKTHLHNLGPGILPLLVTGYLSNAISYRVGRTTVAIFFGIGAALTLDEFALWIHLKDVYRQKQGRRSIDVVIIAATIDGLVLLGFWHEVVRAIARHA